MSLLVMAVFDTEENGRSEYTDRTLRCLQDTVDWSRHRLVVVDNGSCDKTKRIIDDFGVNIITNPTNLGTARAINQGIKLRRPNENVTKVDNDVVIYKSGWVDEMEEAIERDPTIGILGLKRKDIDFDASHDNPDYRSVLVQLPHKPGETWITVEHGTYIMGTCTMFNWRLIDKIGAMKQCGVYGIDDTLYSLRSELAGFWNAYLPHINIDHIDRGDNPYTAVKQQQANEIWDEYTRWHKEYLDGTRPLWEDF